MSDDDSWRPHIVRQGETLTRLAALHGFDAEAVWEDGRNAGLRAERDSPDVLASGDLLYIPRCSPAPRPLSTQTRNRFRAPARRVPVTIVVERDGRALANASCVIEGLPRPEEARTDGEGVLSFAVPPHVERVRVRFVDPPWLLEVRVGHLDPVSSLSGLAGRLQNLGHLAPGWEGLREEDREACVRDALAIFQESQDRSPSGQADDETRRALVDAHGG